jgi:hypothetical protein
MTVFIARPPFFRCAVCLAVLGTGGGLASITHERLFQRLGTQKCAGRARPKRLTSAQLQRGGLPWARHARHAHF